MRPGLRWLCSLLDSKQLGALWTERRAASAERLAKQHLEGPHSFLATVPASPTRGKREVWRTWKTPLSISIFLLSWPQPRISEGRAISLFLSVDREIEHLATVLRSDIQFIIDKPWCSVVLLTEPLLSLRLNSANSLDIMFLNSRWFLTECHLLFFLLPLFWKLPGTWFWY